MKILPTMAVFSRFVPKSISLPIIIIPFIWISITNSVKRLHDLGKSGWLALLFLIPVVNLIFGIYVAFFKGEEFDNKYGPNPY